MKLKLTDLIDVNTLQMIQDGFASATGLAALTTDADGKPVTRGSNFTDFCMELTRKSAKGCERCEQCDAEGGRKTMSTGRAAAYGCHAGLVDFAAPIMLNGEMIGSFIGGQVLPNPPDEAQFRRIAKDLNIDPDAYVRAVKKVPIMPKKQIDAAANFLCTIANVLSQAAYSNYISKQSNTDLSHKNAELLQKFDTASELIASNTKSLHELKDKFSELEKLTATSVSEVNSTRDTIKVIQDIALNTRILGFNASIEASRAKESGKGFGVIAQEVRSLADTSKSSADKIEGTMKSITSCSGKIDENVKVTRELFDTCIKNMNEFAEIIKEIQNIK